jgi:fibronectin-binding autotransporter adhesin
MNTTKASKFTAATKAAAKRMAKRGMRGFVCAAGTLFAVGALTANATTYTWTQTAGNAQNWEVNGNWSGGAWPTPASGDTVDFSTANIAANTTLTLQADRTADFWKFGDTSNGQDWTVNAGNTITLSGATPTIEVVNRTVTLNNVLDGTSGLTKVGAGTLTLSAANSYSGATYLKEGTLTLSGSGSILNSTIVPTGGSITLVNTAAETGFGRVSDSAAITSNGGTITYNNTSGANVYAETIGAVTLTSGPLNFNLSVNQASTGSQTLTLSGLTQAGSGAVTFSAATTAPNATKNMIKVTGASGAGAGQNLPGGVIIGPWATIGTAANNQNDYAVYDASGYIVPANIAASAETTWTTVANAYTLSIPAKTATALTATRNITALKASSTASAASATSGNSSITITGGHSFVVGDPVAVSSFSGDLNNFNVGRLYYVASVPSSTTVTLAATPGGAAITPGASKTLEITGGLKVDNGTNLCTTGILNSGNAPLAIGRTAAGGEVTLPTAGAGNLYLTTGLSPVTSANSGLNGRISIEAPIVDNGGALTLVKNGAGVLRLQGTSTYTGGTVINAGTVIFTDNNNFGSAATPITFNGSGALSFGPNSSWAFASGGTIALSRPIALNNGAIAGFYYNSPNTTMNITGAITGDGGITVGKDPVVTYGGGDGTISIWTFSSTGHTFTGPLIMLTHSLTFNSFADGTGSIILGAVTFSYGSGAAANMSVPNRLVDLRGNGTIQNSSGSKTVTLGAVSTTTTGAKTLALGTGGAGGFAAGNISNGAGTIGVNKTSTGDWTLSGTNTYSGITGADNVTLTIRSKPALSPNSIISFDSSNGAAGAGSGKLYLYMDDAGTVVLGNQINVRTVQTSGGVTAQWTINVANNGGATTGSTLVLGKMNFANITDPRAGGYILNVTGANGYGLQIGDVDLAPSVGRDGGTGSGTFQPGQGFNPTTAPLTITGTVRQNAASVAASGTYADRLVLWGSHANNTISGSIMDPADYPGNANSKPLRVLKGSTGTWTLSGANTYSGTTLVSGGTLVINGGPKSQCLPDNNLLEISGGKVRLPAGVNEKVGSLKLGAGATITGPTSYGSTASGAAVKNDTYFDVAGTGILYVGMDIPNPGTIISFF